MNAYIIVREDEDGSKVIGVMHYKDDVESVVAQLNEDDCSYSIEEHEIYYDVETAIENLKLYK